jgi:hypothetical protein
MIAFMALASISRCVSPALCPTDEQIINAVRSRDAAVVQAVSNQAAEDDPNSVVLVHMDRIKGVSDVICGDRLPSDLTGNPPVMNCRFTVRYWRRNAFHVARMVQRNAQWEIGDALFVTRDRP